MGFFEETHADYIVLSHFFVAAQKSAQMHDLLTSRQLEGGVWLPPPSFGVIPVLNY